MYILTGRGEDYDFGVYRVIFPAGETHMSFSILITGDNIFEDNEYFNLTIDSSLLPSNVNVMDPYHVTVIIIDDDRKLILE